MPPFGKLEDAYKPAFTAWQSQPTPQNASALLTAIKPAIDLGIQAHVGADASPNIRSRAKKLALQAASSYDPERARLGTHVVNHLQGLKRISRKSQQILQVPERVSLDQAYAHEQHAQLSDMLGREPSTQELADHTGLSMRRLAHLAKYSQPVAEGTLSSIVNSEGEGGGVSPAVSHNPSHIMLDAVYGDLDGPNQRIMEWTLGLHGQRARSNQEIATRLRITPGAVSQRKAIIQARIAEAQDLGLF